MPDSSLIRERRIGFIGGFPAVVRPEPLILPLAAAGSERSAGIEDAEKMALEDFLVSGEADFVFKAFQALQHRLAHVGERKSVLPFSLAWSAAC